MQPGDQVQLKSGGPLMTVESVDSGKVCCIWFHSTSQPQTRTFSAATLKLIDVDDPDSGLDVI